MGIHHDVVTLINQYQHGNVTFSLKEEKQKWFYPIYSPINCQPTFYLWTKWTQNTLNWPFYHHFTSRTAISLACSNMNSASVHFLMQQVSQGGIKCCCGSEVTPVNSCVTHACRLHSFADVGKKDDIQETQIPQYRAVVTELRKFTVPQAFRATKSLTTLLNCICMKHIINSQVISFLSRGTIPQRIRWMMKLKFQLL